MIKNWYAIVNPISGNGKSLKKLNFIKNQFTKSNIIVKIVLTAYKHHEKILVQNAIKQGYTKFISIGGDGTLHHIINGIMQQSFVESHKIKVAVIPVGTGNDWVKTYKIPNKINQAIAILKKEKSIYQDIGKIKIFNDPKDYYFNNVAGIGFDAYVVNKTYSLKKLGEIAYLLGGIIGFFNYKKSKIHIDLMQKKINSKIFMISIGLCKYSGGGLILTDYNNHSTGLFDVTLIKNISFLKLLFNIKNFYNGKIGNLKEVELFKHKNIKINIKDANLPFIQADGELLGQGNLEINLIEKAIQIIVPNVKI